MRCGLCDPDRALSGRARRPGGDALSYHEGGRQRWVSGALTLLAVVVVLPFTIVVKVGVWIHDEVFYRIRAMFPIDDELDQ